MALITTRPLMNLRNVRARARRSLGQVLDDLIPGARRRRRCGRERLGASGTWSAGPLRKRQSEQVQYVASRRVETRIQWRSFEFSGVAFRGQMIAGGTRPAGISVQVLPFASEPLEPHTINATISVPIAAMMPITAPYFRTSSSSDPGRGTDTTAEGTPTLHSVPGPRQLGTAARSVGGSAGRPMLVLEPEDESHSVLPSVTDWDRTGWR
jgi:hypothetical protein